MLLRETGSGNKVKAILQSSITFGSRQSPPWFILLVFVFAVALLRSRRVFADVALAACAQHGPEHKER